jgi:hypothetical protein
LEADICLERFDVFAHQARDRRSVFRPDGFGDADLGDVHHLIADCLALHYPPRTTGSIRLASLFLTLRVSCEPDFLDLFRVNPIQYAGLIDLVRT